MDRFALTGARVFDGHRMLDSPAIVVSGGRIASVLPEAELGQDIPRTRVDGLLAPGFVDAQVNGGGGVLFNDVRSAEGIRAIGAAHRPFGTTGFLPTFITDTRERTAEAIAATRAALAAGGGLPVGGAVLGALALLVGTLTLLRLGLRRAATVLERSPATSGG